MFEPPEPDRARINARLGLLPPPLPELIQRAGDALASGDLRSAQAFLANARMRAPGQPDVLRLLGLLLARQGNLAAAVQNFEAALRAAPDDAMGYWQYAQVCEEAGDIAAAWRLREYAVQHLPDSPMAWADYGEHLARHRQSDQALEPLERATRFAPGYAPAHLKLGEALVACGRAEEGAAAMRRALAIEPAFGAAWINLADIKTVPVTDEEAGRMADLLRGNDIDEGERTAIEFALARVYEDRSRYREAFELLMDANARRKRELRPWDNEKFLEQVGRAEEVFAAPHAAAEDPRLGEGVIFIVGMPRSGTTLVEQILASHPQVRGAGELGELTQVVTEESARLRQFYPDWVPNASAQDWQRLGQRYLELTSHLRNGAARLTDKMPNNWRALGAIRAMLPGAHVVICRRDPLENCWSCFKQYFGSGWEFTYDLDHLALFWKAFDRAASLWAGRDPAHVREQGHEILTEEPEKQIRSLLEFCGLQFDPACLAFHRSRRSVHTLSAAQVRRPMQARRGITAAYGALLDPLRAALGLEPVEAADGGDALDRDSATA
ncbi:MAG TPA: sulfotransferase [Rhodanobacteraceae bacterium]|nr:sulfotransferase [Rhodanobacteraceae bacterium]